MALTGRRQALRGLGAMAVLPLLGGPRLAQGAESRTLQLYNVHTRETFEGVYFREGAYLPEARKALDWLLRDHHAEVAGAIDLQVFDLLWRLGARYLRARAHDVVINIHSAYRTEATNNGMRPEGAAWNSLHKAGRAVDVSVQGYGMSFLANHALNIGAGGVGLYWRARFVHLDTGPPRRWYKRI